MKSALKLTIIVANRNMSDKIVGKLKDNGGNFIHVARAHGSVNSDFLSVLGVGGADKSVILATVDEEARERIYSVLDDDFGFTKNGNGIAFTIPITSVGGPVSLAILSGMAGEEKN